MKINSLQKNGILQLAIILGFLFLLLFLKNKFPRNTPQITLNKKIQEQLDQQKLDFLERQKKFSKKYYVNSITDFTGYQLGLSTKQIDSLLSYYKTGNLIYNFEEFRKITNLDTLKINSVRSRLFFPKKKRIYQHSSKVTRTSKNIKRYNLNKVSAIELEKNLKLPSFIAKRVINYRTYLKGYQNINQIEKVYDILPYQIDRIKKQCYIK